jgi:3-hydroxyacyl-CoA dehydrogenase/enoyl-CoA hydratase/3-hydroxybutyryl-CoA epimerase
VRQVDIVIEAAVEKMDLKKKIFKRLGETTGPETVLATNTSALSITEIASVTLYPGRVLGLHFFNPVHRMQLVEVVVGRRTEPDVVQRALRLVQSIGKLPVVVKDSPGFLVNRILMPYLIEAGHLFEAGAAVEDLDEAMLDFGMPMGPLRLLDEVGVDVAHHVSEELEGTFSQRMRVPRVLTQMVAAGLLGRKGERGFYTYNSRKPEVNSGVRIFQDKDWARRFGRDLLQKRMALLMVNEAARCLEEGIVDNPADVDFGMIMGTGFAPFRGGPLRHADTLGLENVAAEMKRLADGGAAHFEPCALLQSLAAERKTFYTEKGGG